MASQAKTRRDQAEIDLQVQVENLGREILKESSSYRKIKVEMNKAEDKMHVLKNIHANYCKLANIPPSSAESLTFIKPLSTLFQTKMDEAEEAIDTHEEATGPEAQEELENEIAKVKP